MNLKQLAKVLFTQEPGACGVCPIVNSSGYDNESCIEILLNLLSDGLRERGHQFESLLDDSLLDYYNQRLQYVGFRIKVEVIETESLNDYIYFGSIRNERFFLNKFHPFRLMDAMQPEEIPPSYASYFENPDFLHQVMMIQRHDTGVIMFRFYPVNLIINGRSVDISRM